MTRVDPTSTQRTRLFEANAYRCCVCKRSGVGLHLHHIDGDNSNTVDENLGVLCVEDHDRHHRPGAYRPTVNHLDLGAAQILQHKKSWEAFVAEARQTSPKVLATLSCYGTHDVIHSLQLVLQWPDERIEYKRSFHLLDATFDKLTDAVFEELQSIGPNVKLAVIDAPLPVDHCPCCGTGYSRTMKPAVVTRLTDPTWSTDSACSIYINPDQASLAMTFALRDQQLFSASLHLCKGQFLHYMSDGIDETLRVQRKPSVRTQATRLIEKVLDDWKPARILIGTGDHDAPTLIDDLRLPSHWEQRARD